ncbi:MAG: tetratricopeptide repeat protein [Planctomycetota bacterium]|jgi:tetratricopeptide (TPR) repeat protein
METTGRSGAINKLGEDGTRRKQSSCSSSVKSNKRWGRIELLIVLCIFFFALFIRCFYLYESSANPTFVAPIADSMAYDLLARQLAAGQGMTDEFFWQPIFYPLFLTVVYFLGAQSYAFAKIMQVLLGSISCVLIYFLARRIFSRKAGILAAAVASLYGPLIFFEAELLATGWAAFWSVTLVLLFLKAKDTKRILVCFILGVCGALSIITRPTFLPFFLVGCLWLAFTFYRSSKLKQLFVLSLATILLGFATIAVPAGLLCYDLTGHFGIFPSSGGLNLYIGNNPDSQQTIIVRPGQEWEDLMDMPQYYGTENNRWQSQKFFYKKVSKYMLTQPLDFSKGIMRKTLKFFSSRELPRNINIYIFRRWSSLLGLLMWKAGGFGFPFGLVLPLAIVGLIFRWRQIPAPVILFLFFYAGAIILVFVSSRYRVPMVPVICCLSAGGVGAIGQMLRSHQWKRLAIACVLLFAIGFGSGLGGPFAEEKVNYEAELYYGLGCYALQWNQIDRAVSYNKTAVRLNPQFDAAYNNLGVALAKHGELEKAILQFEKALQLKPNDIRAHRNMARALVRKGEPDAAIEHLKEALKLDPSPLQVTDILGPAPAEIREVADVIKYYSAVLRINPNDAGAHYYLGKAFAEQNRMKEAVKHYQQAVRLKSNWPDALNSLAWVYATNKNSELRNGAAAVRLAQRACELTVYKNVNILDTLAAAYAEAGNFTEAVKTAQTALELAISSSQDSLAEKIRKRLQLYKAHKTYRR